MRQSIRNSSVLTWLAMAAASVLSLAAHAAIPQTVPQTAPLTPTPARPLPIIRRLPPVVKPQPTAFSIEEISAFDGQRLFDDSAAPVFEIPSAVPGKPRVGGWIEGGYGNGWTVN